MVSVSVSKKNYKKKYRYRFRKNLVSEKVLVSVSKNFGIEKSIGFGFEKFWYRKKYRYRYRKKFGIEKSIGFGIEKIWYRKKVSDSVSFRFWVSSHTAGQWYTPLLALKLFLVSVNKPPCTKMSVFSCTGSSIPTLGPIVSAFSDNPSAEN